MKQSVVARACALVFVGLACAPVSAGKKKEPAPEVLAPTHGYVFADVRKGNAFPFYVERIGAKREFVQLHPREGDGEDAQRSVGGWLPAGEYHVASYDGVEFGEDMRFEVKAGRVTDLGSLLPVSAGGYDIVLLPVREAENENDVDAAVRQFASVLTDPAPIRWTPARPPQPGKIGVPFDPVMGGGLLASAIANETHRKNRPDAIPSLEGVATIPEFLKRAKQFAQPAANGVPDGAGRVYFPADLGAIRVRAQDGAWTTIDTGVVARIGAVFVATDSMLAGTDDGRLLRSTDGGATWSLAARVPADETLIDIARAGDQWFFTTERYLRHSVSYNTITTDIDAVRVYSAPVADLSAPTVMQTFKFEPTSGWGVMQMQKPRAHMTAQGYFVLAGDGVQRYDLATRTWRRVPTPKGKVSSFRFDATDKTMVAYGPGTMVAKVFLSRDGGETWTTIAKPSIRFREVIFDADGNGQAFNIDFGPKTERWELEEFNATTKGDWERTSFLPIRCRPMSVGAGVPPLCVTTGSDIHALRDGKWKKEFDAQ